MFVLILVNTPDLEYTLLFKFTSVIMLFSYTQPVFACVFPVIFYLHIINYFTVRTADKNFAFIIAFTGVTLIFSVYLFLFVCLFMNFYSQP